MNSIYIEPEDGGNSYRMEYYEGLKKVIDQRREDYKKQRIAFGHTIAQEREAMRKKYLEMLGWPLIGEERRIRSVKKWVIYEDAQYEITRMQLEVLPGLPFYGILFRHKTEEALPMVISQHGGLGTPEICSSFFDSANYNDMTLRVFTKGVNVFAPQMLLWRTETYGDVGKDSNTMRRDMDNDLKQLGGSITALEIFVLQCCLDYLEEQPYCNGHFGMTGLSYGGYYTLYAAAAEPRIRASLACSHFNDRITYNWYDKVWFNSAAQFLDAQVGALVCPRFLRIEVGDKDELLDPKLAAEEYAILKEYYTEVPEKLQFRIFAGLHEYCPDADEEGIMELLKNL